MSRQAELKATPQQQPLDKELGRQRWWHRLLGQMPSISVTERAALEAGDVWIEAQLFAGRPNLAQILAQPYPRLDERERAFLEGPVQEVCDLLDPQLLQRTGDLGPAVWKVLRRHRFFGLGLPREWDGHGFSALAQSTIFGKLASCSMALSTTVLIPNSVGPGELLLEVGTEEQQRHYLPRLAWGEEIPCFALTEPAAGSDAAGLRSRAILRREQGDEGGEARLVLHLDFDKRYITLAPIATLIGLAVRLYDPEGLLGGAEDLGITVVLVPADTPGVEIGRRHDPMGLPFANGPIRGRNVVLPIEQILGGTQQVGRGWPLLMEALAGGRAVSLPAQAVAGAKHCARVAGTYAMVRRQFGLPIGRFEGVEEALARLAGLTYLMDAARVFTCGALAAGRRPAVTSALMKWNLTELARELARDAMDVQAGAGLCRGPRNLLADAYIGTPIAITVEGANILTRTLIVFGQGALRCHPNLRRLLAAAEEGKGKQLLVTLARQAWSTLGLLLRAPLFALGGSRLLVRGLGAADPSLRPALRRLGRAANAFALLADLALASQGARLKRRGKLSGRFADALGWMMLALASWRRFEAEGRQDKNRDLVQWAMAEALRRVQVAMEGILANFAGGPLGWFLRGPALMWCRLHPVGRPPSDRLGARVAATLRQDDGQQQHLLANLWTPADSEHPLNQLQEAFALALRAEPLRAKLRRARQRGELPASYDLAQDPELGYDRELDLAAQLGLLSDEQAQLLRQAELAARQALSVDDFAPAELFAWAAQAEAEAARANGVDRSPEIRGARQWVESA